jgi:hypothetical protein
LDLQPGDFVGFCSEAEKEGMVNCFGQIQFMKKDKGGLAHLKIFV